MPVSPENRLPWWTPSLPETLRSLESNGQGLDMPEAAGRDISWGAEAGVPRWSCQAARASGAVCSKK